MQSIRLTDGQFAGRLIGKYGWSIAQAADSRGAMVHREPSRAHASSATSLHVDVHLRQLRSMVQMVNANVANKIEQRLQAERGLTERALVREIRELALGDRQARAEQRQDGQGPTGPRQVVAPRPGTRQEGPTQAGARQDGLAQTGPRQVVTPQPRPRQDGAAEAGQRRNGTSRAEPGQDGSPTAGQAVRRDGAGTESSRASANPLTHRTARPSEQAANGQGAGGRSERQGDMNAPRPAEGRHAQPAGQERNRPAAGRNEGRNEREAKQAASPRDERLDSETVAQVLARQRPQRDNERRTDRRLLELARRIEAIDPAGGPAAGTGRIGDATPFGRSFPIRVARSGAFSPRSLGGGIAERDEASRALRQATQWIRNQAWSGMPVLERAPLPEHRSRTGPGIVYRTMRALAAQDWNRVAVVERLRERLSPAGQTGRRGGDVAADRAAAQATGSPRTTPGLLDGAVRAAAAVPAERGLAVGRRSAAAALEPLRPISLGAARQEGEGSPAVAGERVVSRGSPLGQNARRSVAEEARGRDELVPRATIYWSTPDRPRSRAEEGAASALRPADPGQVASSGDRPARGATAERNASQAGSTNAAAGAVRTASNGEALDAAPRQATIVSAPTRRDDFLLVRALGQLARAGSLRERLEERHGLTSAGSTASAPAERETASRVVPVASVARETTRVERVSTTASAPAQAPAPATIVVRANDGEPRASAPVARPVRPAAPIGQTVLRPIAAAGHGVPTLVERVRQRAGEGLHAAAAAELAMNGPGSAASGAASGAVRQEHRQVRQVRLTPREAEAKASGTAAREGAAGTGDTATVATGATSAAGSASDEATSRGSASATGGTASPELRHAAAAGPSAPTQGQAAASRASVMPGPAAPDRFASHRTAMKHAMRAQTPLRRGNPGQAPASRGAATAPRAASPSAQAPARTTQLEPASPAARGEPAAPMLLPAAQALPAAPANEAAMPRLGLQVARRHARAANAANPLASSPVLGAAPTPLVQAPAAASRGQAVRIPAAPGQAPDAGIGPALVVPGAAAAASATRAPVDRPLPRLDVPARAAEKPGRDEQAIRTLEVAVKTIEQELGQAKELWAKPKLDVNRLADEMVKAVAKRMKQDRQRRGI